MIMKGAKHGNPINVKRCDLRNVENVSCAACAMLRNVKTRLLQYDDPMHEKARCPCIDIYIYLRECMTINSHGAAERKDRRPGWSETATQRVKPTRSRSIPS